jgi:hypothetical protein
MQIALALLSPGHKKARQSNMSGFFVSVSGLMKHFLFSANPEFLATKLLA